jgi:hypothetical protein
MPCCPVWQVTSKCFTKEACCLVQAPQEAVSICYAGEGTPSAMPSPRVDAVASPAAALFSSPRLCGAGCRDVFNLKADLRI